MWGRSITFAFVAVWVGAGAVWIILDWIGNPNRGAFRPAGRRGPRNLRQRLAARAHRRAEEDAAVRATLRERYGRSSLRLIWNDDRERRVAESDSQLITDPLRAADPIEPTLADWPLLLDAEFDTVAAPGPPEPESSPRSTRGWKIGIDPLVPTRSGASPTKATIRARVWKNLAAAGSLAPEQFERMRAGRPPRRTNLSTGKTETARVDLATGLPFWPGETSQAFAEYCRDKQGGAEPHQPGR